MVSYLIWPGHSVSFPLHEFLNEENTFLDYFGKAIGLSDWFYNFSRWLLEANGWKPMDAESQWLMDISLRSGSNEIFISRHWRSCGNPLPFANVRMLLLLTSWPLGSIGWCHASSVTITTPTVYKYVPSCYGKMGIVSLYLRSNCLSVAGTQDPLT